MTDHAITELLQPMGLILLGSLAVTAADAVPDLDDKRSARALLMIGNGGSSFWEVFGSSSEYLDGRPDPLDRWSRRTGKQIGSQLGGLAIFPFDGPPYFPFQGWAKKTGRTAPSPVSMMMHAQFGLWHAYRFAIALPKPPNGPGSARKYESPCSDCRQQPCLRACPVKAFNGDSFNNNQCVEYLAKDRRTTCRLLGCEARRACPQAREFIYVPPHAQFHMNAFVHSQRP